MQSYKIAFFAAIMAFAPFAARAADTPIVEISIGAKDAPVTMVEVSAPICPTCSDFAANIFPELQRKYIDTGILRIVYRPAAYEIKDNSYDLRNSVVAASWLVAACVGGDQAYLVVNSIAKARLTEDDKEASKAAFKAAVEEHGLTDERLEQCFNATYLEAYRQQVGSAWARLELANVRGIPQYFVNRKRVAKRTSVADFEAAIEAALVEAKTAKR